LKKSEIAQQSFLAFQSVVFDRLILIGLFDSLRAVLFLVAAVVPPWGQDLADRADLWTGVFCGIIPLF